MRGLSHNFENEPFSLCLHIEVCHLTHVVLYSRKDIKGQKWRSIPSSLQPSQLCDLKEVSVRLSLLISTRRGVTEAHPGSQRGPTYQAPPSMGFSRQEYWSGVPLPSPLYIHYFI